MLEKVEKQMALYVGSLDDEATNKFFQTLPSGKKLRSKLILNIAGDCEDAIKLSAIVELIHLASLLHDDVIDESQTRRGKPSFNAKYGDKNAIMLGDILYSKAFFELSSMQDEIAKIISNAVSELSIGELLDVELSNSFNHNKEKYMDMIYKKTASLIEASSKAAAILANKNIVNFSTYGKNLGLAFQIVDDILDITQDSQVLGKPALQDFREGKTTLPYIYMYEKLNSGEKIKLLSFFGKELNESQKDWIKQMLDKTNALKIAIKEAKELGNGALDAIKGEDIPKLNEVVKAMIEREF